jgi:hypothetical protein
MSNDGKTAGGAQEPEFLVASEGVEFTVTIYIRSDSTDLEIVNARDGFLCIPALSQRWRTCQKERVRCSWPPAVRRRIPGLCPMTMEIRPQVRGSRKHSRGHAEGRGFPGSRLTAASIPGLRDTIRRTAT